MVEQSASSDPPATGSWRERLSRPVDNGWLLVVRMAFGWIMVWEVFRYVFNGWIPRYFIQPKLNLAYEGFAWVKPWPGDGMYWHFAALGILALGIATGCFYRLCSWLFCAGFTYVFLLEESRYLNHFYLVCLLAFLLAMMPAEGGLSIDARRQPKLRRSTTPVWTLWLMRLQVGVVYFYGGIAKINVDWLDGWPLRIWLPRSARFPGLRETFEDGTMALALSWGGMLFDLFLVPALLWRRTRYVALAIAFLFHFMNSYLFSIGIFPTLGFLVLTVFFEPDWPRRFFQWPVPPPGAAEERETTVIGRFALGVVTIFAAAQLLLPLRHWAYPGEVMWTEEGLRFAWHMKLRTKRGSGRFAVTDPGTGNTQLVDPLDYLTDRQVRRVVTRPYVTHQFAQFLAEELQVEGRRPEVRASLKASLNGRKYRELIDPTVDLAAVPYGIFQHAPWIRPLDLQEERPSRSSRDL